MTEKMRRYLTDETGRTLSREERMSRPGLDIPFASQLPQQGPPPSGSSSQRQQQRHEIGLLQSEIAADIRAQASNDKPVTNPYAGRIADLQSQLQWATLSERPGLERRLYAMKRAGADWEAERATAERRATFEASEDFQRVKTHHDATMRSRDVLYPDLTDADALLLTAVATSDSYLTPRAQAAAYFEAVSKVEAIQAQREAERLAAAEQVAVKASTEYAQQKARVQASDRRIAELPSTESENE